MDGAHSFQKEIGGLGTQFRRREEEAQWSSEKNIVKEIVNR